MLGTLEPELIKFAHLILGFGIAWVIGRCVVSEWLMKGKLRITIGAPSIIAADAKQQEKWDAAFNPSISSISTKGGYWLGVAEQFAVVAAFSFFRTEVTTLLGGWLVFKTAAKWAVWEHIHKFPDKFLESLNVLDEIRIRNEVGSITFTRFLLGTLSNILAGVVGYSCATVVIIWVRSYIGWQSVRGQ